MTTPLEKMINATVVCTVCSAPMGKCDCWTKCTTPGCTWSYRKGEFCQNCNAGANKPPEMKKSKKNLKTI